MKLMYLKHLKNHLDVISFFDNHIVANLFPKLLASGKLTYDNLVSHCGNQLATKIPKEGLYYLIMP
jgi:hypothetical protein